MGDRRNFNRSMDQGGPRFPRNNLEQNLNQYFSSNAVNSSGGPSYQTPAMNSGPGRYRNNAQMPGNNMNNQNFPKGMGTGGNTTNFTPQQTPQRPPFNQGQVQSTFGGANRRPFTTEKGETWNYFGSGETKNAMQNKNSVFDRLDKPTTFGGVGGGGGNNVDFDFRKAGGGGGSNTNNWNNNRNFGPNNMASNVSSDNIKPGSGGGGGGVGGWRNNNQSFGPDNSNGRNSNIPPFNNAAPRNTGGNNKWNNVSNFEQNNSGRNFEGINKNANNNNLNNFGGQQRNPIDFKTFKNFGNTNNWSGGNNNSDGGAAPPPNNSWNDFGPRNNPQGPPADNVGTNNFGQFTNNTGGRRPDNIGPNNFGPFNNNPNDDFNMNKNMAAFGNRRFNEPPVDDFARGGNRNRNFDSGGPFGPNIPFRNDDMDPDMAARRGDGGNFRGYEGPNEPPYFKGEPDFIQGKRVFDNMDMKRGDYQDERNFDNLPPEGRQFDRYEHTGNWKFVEGGDLERAQREESNFQRRRYHDEDDRGGEEELHRKRMRRNSYDDVRRSNEQTFHRRDDGRRRPPFDMEDYDEDDFLDDDGGHDSGSEKDHHPPGSVGGKRPLTIYSGKLFLKTNLSRPAKEDPITYWRRWWQKYAYIEHSIEQIDKNDEYVKFKLKFKPQTDDVNKEAMEYVEWAYKQYKLVTRRLTEANYRSKDLRTLLKLQGTIHYILFNIPTSQPQRARLRGILRHMNHKVHSAFIYQDIIEFYHRCKETIRRFENAEISLSDEVTQAYCIMNDRLYIHFLYDSIIKLKVITNSEFPDFLKYYKSLQKKLNKGKPPPVK
ncbi:uncharacterized protein isoform X4 [Musca autumnalis]|uniref:uncharacterized protein isoform X4 n=1 Tax=Musca autumnalis TaxID=221902 RepID=UPI003CF08F64